MKAKVIEVLDKNDNKVQVCLRLEQDGDGEDFVKISAWQEDGETFYYQETQVDFSEARNNFAMCEKFIDDFSNESAQEFIDTWDI